MISYRHYAFSARTAGSTWFSRGNLTRNQLSADSTDNCIEPVCLNFGQNVMSEEWSPTAAVTKMLACPSAQRYQIGHASEISRPYLGSFGALDANSWKR